MFGEALTLHHFDIQKHDSMYVLLLPSVYCLFYLLLHFRGKRRTGLRTISLIIYIIHPFMIVVIRLFAKLLHLQSLLVENSLVHYIAVCFASVVFAVVITALLSSLKPKKAKHTADTDRAYLEINLNNLAHNVNTLQKAMSPKCELMAVVKAEAYVINEEQAETVRMIFDLYLQGFGSMKIAQILTERKRKTATGLIKWSVSNIMRAIKNATYTGTKCYNKSRSNNFLEQKRINNLDMSTYEYVEGDFPAIVSQEIWDKAQAIRESRMKPALVSAEKTTHSKRDSRDIWVNKLRCSCGSSYRKNKWHTKLDGKTSYGYQCYNQLNNGIRRKRAEIGLDTEGYCDSRMITDWKLDFMAKALLEHLWQERKESVLIALDLIRHYYKEERTLDNKSDAASIQARIDKANSRLANLIAMRADGEISKDEYQSMRSPIDKEIKELQKALEDTPTNKCCPRGLDLEGIRSTLNSLIDFSGSTISHDVINQFVYMVTPTSDTTFDWYVNLNGTADVKATFTAEGRKKSCIIKLEEIEKISSLHRKENEDNAHLIKNPIVFAFLHRLPSRPGNKP